MAIDRHDWHKWYWQKLLTQFNYARRLTIRNIYRIIGPVYELTIDLIYIKYEYIRTLNEDAVQVVIVVYNMYENIKFQLNLYSMESSHQWVELLSDWYMA